MDDKTLKNLRRPLRQTTRSQ